MPLNIFNDRSLTGKEVNANAKSFRAIQGYILVSHGRKHVWLALLRFRAPEARKPELRAFLKDFGSRATNSFALWEGLQRYREAKEKRSAPEHLRGLKETI